MAKAPYEKERELQRDVARTVENALPGVEVLALELTGKDRFCVYVDHAQGVDHALCERVTDVLRSYLDQYADTNKLVVLYPQAEPDAAFTNPKGCWDWWGYLGGADTGYATRSGPQMVAVMKMVHALGG